MQHIILFGFLCITKHFLLDVHAEPEELTVNLLASIIHNEETWFKSELQSNIEVLNDGLVEWLQKLDVHPDLIEINLKEIELMEKNTAMKSHTWKFNLERNDNTEVSLDYILIRVDKTDNDVTINSKYDYFKQDIPIIYEKYVYDHSPRRWGGIAGPRDPHYAFRSRELHPNEIDLVKTHVTKYVNNYLGM